MTESREILDALLGALDAWEEPHDPHPSLKPDPARLGRAMDEFTARLTAPTDGEEDGIYPFGHPRYAGQMLKPPHPVAWAAYAAAMRLNPNNHALDGGPATGRMEKEVVRDLAAMFGFPSDALGHLTSGGTVANLEALFIAREVAREVGRTPRLAVSAEGHYTHARMAHVLGVEVVTLPTDATGRLDLDGLADALREHDITVVVLTAGTTGLGAVDPIAEAIPLCREHGARVHIDAAYGGFFCLLAGSAEASGEVGAASGIEGLPTADFCAIAEADSVVVDPHKHGLQPYGCGAILLRDPSEGRFYRHDSPYTYFTSDALHLGEISLECSRAGAAAAALWLTLRALPLAPDDGLGPILATTLRAARELASRLEASERYRVLAPPTLDIVGYYPEAGSLTAVDAASAAVFDRGMSEPDPVYLSLFRVDADRFPPEIARDAPHARILRSVLMKPEHELWAERLADRLEAVAAS
ncbi:MAG: aminotransferase class V-fold PLP-dependent enzyme [Bacteroidota bacterium]